LERKCASIEAKLTRIRSERNEYREASEKLVVEQTALLAHAQSAMSRQQIQGGVSSPHEVASLQDDLRAALNHITTLEASIKKLEDQYHARMK
jgi:predicted  nucleic acid-binding Zn-ribbon protein